MRSARAILLAIVATLALAGSIASTADAKDRPNRAATTVVTDDGSTSDLLDPSDPLIPPGP